MKSRNGINLSPTLRQVLCVFKLISKTHWSATSGGRVPVVAVFAHAFTYLLRHRFDNL